MSFDLHLERLHSGEPAPVDRAKVLAVLRRHCQDSAGPFGIYTVKFADGSRVEFSAKHLESEGKLTGCGFHLRGLTPAVVQFVFDVAVAGDMVIFNPQGASDSTTNPLAIPVAPGQLPQLPDGVMAAPVVCDSPRQLAQLLGVGFEQWAGYRDRVIGKTPD